MGNRNSPLGRSPIRPTNTLTARDTTAVHDAEGNVLQVMVNAERSEYEEGSKGVAIKQRVPYANNRTILDNPLI